MFGDIEFALRNNLRDREYAEEYAQSFLNTFVATQIKVVREQRGMTQATLGNRIGTTQAGVSRYEDVNYSSWSLRTLMKIARAFDVRLRVSFEPYGTLPDEVVRLDRARLETVERKSDPGLIVASVESRNVPDRTANIGAYRALPPSDNLRRALDPTRPIAPQGVTIPSAETKRKEERNAIDSGAACKSLRLLDPRGTDTGNGNLSSKPSGLSGGEMPISKEPEYTPRIQSA